MSKTIQEQWIQQKSTVCVTSPWVYNSLTLNWMNEWSSGEYDPIFLQQSIGIEWSRILLLSLPTEATASVGTLNWKNLLHYLLFIPWKYVIVLIYCKHELLTVVYDDTGSVDIFSPFRSHTEYLTHISLSSGYFWCLLQYKIPVNFLFFSCVLKHDNITWKNHYIWNPYLYVGHVLVVQENPRVLIFLIQMDTGINKEAVHTIREVLELPQ